MCECVSRKKKKISKARVARQIQAITYILHRVNDNSRSSELSLLVMGSRHGQTSTRHSHDSALCHIAYTAPLPAVFRYESTSMCTHMSPPHHGMRVWGRAHRGVRRVHHTATFPVGMRPRHATRTAWQRSRPGQRSSGHRLTAHPPQGEVYRGRASRRPRSGESFTSVWVPSSISFVW